MWCGFIGEYDMAFQQLVTYVHMDYKNNLVILLLFSFHIGK
jgi:hypothetical protein